MDKVASNLATEAADRIEQLEAQLRTAKAEGMELAAKIVDNIEPIDCNGLSVQDIAEAIRAAKEKL